MRKKEVEKLRAKKPPRAHCAQVPIPNPRKLDPSSLVCAHRNLLSRSLGVGRSCPCFPRCLPCYPQLSYGVIKWSLVVAPWFLLIFSERQSTGFPTPGLKSLLLLVLEIRGFVCLDFFGDLCVNVGFLIPVMCHLCFFFVFSSSACALCLHFSSLCFF